MDTSKSLQELENEDWGEPDEAPTALVAKCLALRRVPLEQLNAENCRMLLGQQVSPHFLLPIALKFLYENSMESGDFAPGALLNNVLRLPASFWADEQELWWQINEIVTEVEMLKQSIEEMAPEIENFKTLQAE